MFMHIMFSVSFLFLIVNELTVEQPTIIIDETVDSEENWMNEVLNLCMPV